MTPADASLILSIQPQYVQLIQQGLKTVELRRVPPAIIAGNRVLIYSSAPTMAFVGTFEVASMQIASVDSVWRKVRTIAGVSRAEYLAYYAGAQQAVAIHITDLQWFDRPITLNEIRKRVPGFQPPQSYRYLRSGCTMSDGIVQLLTATSLSPAA